MPKEQNSKTYYEIDGVQYPRVTNILGSIEKPGLARWRGRVGNTEADRVSKESTEFGIGFHELVADINRGEHLHRGWQPPGQYREMAFSYIDWLHKYVTSIEAVEERVHSELDRYAGTLDLSATFRGDDLSSIIDIKTSKQPSLDWPLQLAAYKKAKKEMGLLTQRRVIIQVMKIPPYEVIMYDYKDHEADEFIWDEILHIWKWLQLNEVRHAEAIVRGGL